jgi:hypothetical protein
MRYVDSWAHQEADKYLACPTHVQNIHSGTDAAYPDPACMPLLPFLKEAEERAVRVTA